MRHFQASACPSEPELATSWAAGVARDGENEKEDEKDGSGKGGWMYTRSDQDGKTEILVEGGTEMSTPNRSNQPIVAGLYSRSRHRRPGFRQGVSNAVRKIDILRTCMIAFTVALAIQGVCFGDDDVGEAIRKGSNQFGIGMKAYKEGQFETALEYLNASTSWLRYARKAIALPTWPFPNPDYPEKLRNSLDMMIGTAHLSQCSIHISREHFPDALKECEKALGSKERGVMNATQESMAVALRGLCHHRLGSKNKAVRDCRYARALDPDNSVAIELEAMLKR